MVLQKFHTVFNKQIPKPFYTISDNGNYLILQNNLLQIFADNDTQYLDNELSSRQDLLEYGFEIERQNESLDIDEKLEFV